jgi:hypothetical protein
LLPVLNGSDSIPKILEHQSYLGKNPTSTILTNLICKVIPLNKKQQIITERVLSEALCWANYPYDATKQEQTLLYIRGEGGVSKSQVIKGIEAGIDLIYHKHKIILMALTGAAADQIGRNTCHTSLSISLNQSQ